MLKYAIIENAGAIADDRIDAMLIVNKPGGEPEITGPKNNPLLMLALLNDAQRKILVGLAKVAAEAAKPEPAEDA